MHLSAGPSALETLAGCPYCTRLTSSLASTLASPPLSRASSAWISLPRPGADGGADHGRPQRERRGELGFSGARFSDVTAVYRNPVSPGNRGFRNPDLAFPTRQKAGDF